VLDVICSITAQGHLAAAMGEALAGPNSRDRVKTLTVGRRDEATCGVDWGLTALNIFATIRGMEMRTFAIDYPQEAARDDTEVAQLFRDGRIRPYIGARFPLQDAASALRHVADRKAMGKVIIDVD
jgi:NADPH:quinone reductase-like Zn-dependent oxidoreductase